MIYGPAEHDTCRELGITFPHKYGVGEEWTNARTRYGVVDYEIFGCQENNSSILKLGLKGIIGNYKN